MNDNINMIKSKKIFDETGSDAVLDRSILNGNSTGIMNLNSIRFKWAPTLMKIMQNNFWLPEKVSLVEDRVSLKELTPDELRALKSTLSFLIALDSMQVNNIPTLSEYITAPEVSALFTVQAYQELVHSQSYQYILQELFPNLEREDIYNYWRTDPILLERNKTIANMYQKFAENKTEDNFKLALAADYVLEGIYFYAGFNFFYQLASRNKGVEIAKIIKYIENDEVTHVSLMNYLIKETFNEDDMKMLAKVIDTAVQQEIQWGQHTYGDSILGISKESTENYIKYIANNRAKSVGIGVLYKGFTVNPYAYLDMKKKENFFETSVTEYSQSTAVAGWDDF
jgi:ribonucleoside-diphosphate reductase beta chain